MLWKRRTFSCNFIFGRETKVAESSIWLIGWVVNGNSRSFHQKSLCEKRTVYCRDAATISLVVKVRVVFKYCNRIGNWASNQRKWILCALCLSYQKKSMSIGEFGLFTWLDCSLVISPVLVFIVCDIIYDRNHFDENDYRSPPSYSPYLDSIEEI